MKRLKLYGVGKAGYTVIETMIVLAASGALVVSVIALISGQQGKTQFSQGVRDADSQLADVMNDFGTGYLANTGSVSCTASATPGSKPSLSTPTPAPKQGTNVGCVYAGRIIVPAANSNNYVVHGLVGRQFQGDVFSAQSSDIVNARPVVLRSSNTSSTDLSVNAQFSPTMRFIKAVYLDTSGNEQVAGPFGVVSNFGATTAGSLVSDKQTPQLFIMIPSATAVEDRFESGITNADFVLNRPLALCFESDSSNQYAVIQYGTSTGSTASVTTIGGGTCPADLIP